MALSNLNTLSETAYFSLLYDMLKQRENPFLLAGTGFQRIHNGGGDGNPTFGYGFNLAAFNANIVEQVISHAYSGVLTGQQGDGLDLILDWKTGAPVWVGGQSVTLTNANIINMADVSLNGAPGAFGGASQRAALQSLVLNDAQATRMLDVMVKGDLNLVHIEGPAGSYGYEDGLDFRLAEEGVLPYSAERAALLSVYYNAPSLIGPGVQNAVLNDDRAQLWYEIRYNHNHFNNNGLQNRRAEEADLLGLVSQAAQNNPDANILEFAQALDTLFNDDDRLGRRLLTRIEERDGLDDLQAAIAPELQALLDYYVLKPLGANSAPTIEYVQADSNNISQTMNAGSAAAAGVPGGEGAATTVNLILGEGGDDLIFGLGAADYLYGGAGDDTIYGDGGGTSIAGSDGHDLIDGGAGNDLLFGGIGDEYIDGGSGSDRIRGDDGFDNIYGGSGHDTLMGGADNDRLFGGGGNDSLVGNIGDDTLIGGLGNDRLDGNPGDDVLEGRAGNDDLRSGLGNDTIDGGEDQDTLRGNSGDDDLRGGLDDDTVDGGEGADTLRGNSGDDLVIGHLGDDRLSGAGGNDELLSYGGADIARGGSGDDRVFGNTGDDTLFGDDGNDDVRGGNDDDVVNGGAGADTLRGNSGNDTLDGAAGADRLIGGTGDDVFVFAPGGGADDIRDFTAGAGTEDVIDLSGMGASFDEFAEVQAVASDDGDGNIVIDFGGGDVITIEGLAAADLNQDDFIFN